ncbi:GumC family protein [Antarcticimicrobium sediminis]|uniref:non-specific protein-tyrosine kinase n=1 Tax=Antarcticimicrobium sediminis TaxID=2546227 RepID=A0A4R5EV96_9RHOB|nr:polysaccharide biosynthesis tyrosine autokinase [Antarcticimicrobium sediminis]TDE38845.1 polysaccharide biosynthesis tyrosine autokinase [Antarcticimicrobium sediminis]
MKLTSDFHTPPQRQTAQQSDLADDEINILALLATLWRGKLWIVLAMVCSVALAGYQAFSAAVPIYTAEATVALENRQSSVSNLEDVVSGLSTDQGTINTELEVLISRTLLGRVVNRLDLTADPDFNAALREDPGFSLGSVIALVRTGIKSLFGNGDQPAPREKTDEEIFNNAIDTLKKMVSVSNPRNSYIFAISAQTTSPQKSAAIANTLADVYIEDQLEVKFEKTRQATEWLSIRVAELQKTVEKSAADLKAFRASSELVSPEALEALNLQVKDRRTRLGEVQSSRAILEGKLAVLKQALESNDRTSLANAAADPALNRLLGEIKAGRQGAEDSFDLRIRQLVQRIEIDLGRAMAQERVLETSITEQEQQLNAQSGEFVRVEQLQREAEANRLLYEHFLTRLKETTVQEGIQQADSRLLSAAIAPKQPSAPKKAQILALGLFLGLFVGCGGVLAREMTQNTFRTAAELEEKTGFAVMGQIPLIPGRSRADIIAYLRSKPTSVASEAIRNLRTSLLLSNVDNPPKTIMLTSSLPGEGKTTLSISLSLNLSGMGKRVLLVEGDIRRRVFNQYFDIHQKQGLLSVIAGEAELEDVVYKNEELGFDILIGEKSSINAADLFSSERFHHFITQARDKYDVVIIDTPPVLVVPDARVIAQSVDAILYSVLWDKTTKSQVAEGLNQFSMLGLGVSGLVLDHIDPKRMKRYGYGGKYGSYYGAYTKGYYDN